MRFPQWSKWACWFVCIALVALGISQRWATISTASNEALDALLLAIAAALLLLPFYSELTILGLTIKQQVDEAKKDITEGIRSDLTELRIELHNAATAASHASSEVNFYRSPDEAELSSIAQRAKQQAAAFHERSGSATFSPTPTLDVPERASLALAASYNIEREVRRIWFATFAVEPGQRVPTPHEMVGDIASAGLLPPSVAASLHEALALANSSMHPPPASKATTDFLHEAVPSLLSILKAIP